MSRRKLFAERSVDMKEKPDPTPIEVGVPAPPSLAELVRRAVQFEVSGKALDQGVETFEEADDFEVDDDLDDLDWSSRYEITELRPEDGDIKDDLNGDNDAPLSEHEQKLYERLRARAEPEDDDDEVIESEAEPAPLDK